ncbi:unnamed protein product [Cylicocyclus nassatus]|uniref:Uncharacterized protein n=1 Tax=Cylicocyclus nassatus TaxID=53992 RepID=A0AA36GPC2_CYLNA|nr:unnamed protein product [Cylicocyclus nassatus]
MHGGDEKTQPEVVFKVDELLESKFIVHYRKTEACALCEAGFCIVLLIFGLLEVFKLNEHVCGYCFVCAAFLFFCLFLQFYFAVIFNCWPLLICHAFQAGGMCLSIFVLLMCSLLLSYPTQITVVQYRITAVLVVATGIIILTVVATFAASSFSRARELWAFEVTHTDHLRRLLIDALDTLEMYKQERTSSSGD